MDQLWIVAVLVVVASAYSLWYVLPAAVRPRLGRMHRWFARSGGCSTACEDCRGCSDGAKPGAGPVRAGEQVIRLYARGK